jgi:hypothetical protein
MKGFFDESILIPSYFDNVRWEGVQGEPCTKPKMGRSTRRTLYDWAVVIEIQH